ncbi:MAG: PEP-CTERM sorting domain-containing protein [Myxococcota bacterium]
MSSLPSSNRSFEAPVSPRTAPRKPVSAWLAAFTTAIATTIAAVAASVSPASATPVDVFFNGPRPASDPNTAFGISLASATTANTTYGVPIITQVDVLSTIANKLSILQPPSSSLIVSPNPPTSSLNRVTSNWQVENVSGAPFAGTTYMLFTHTDPYSVGNTLIDYPDGNVGLKIDKDLGWVIIKARAAGVDYYYPALRLNWNAISTAGTLVTAGSTSNPTVAAAINYVVAQALLQAGGNYQLPELQLGFAQVVPEPGTALLLGLGLTVLAVRRSRV